MDELELREVATFDATLAMTQDLRLGFEILFDIFHIFINPIKSGKINVGRGQGQGNLEKNVNKKRLPKISATRRPQGIIFCKINILIYMNKYQITVGA
jgi:hypothetical protein